MSVFSPVKRIYEKYFKDERYTCLNCGREIFDNGYFCEPCLTALPFNDGYTCDVCGRKQEAEGVCMECKSRRPVYERSASAFVYEGDIRRLVISFKRGKKFIGKAFAEAVLPIIQEKFKDIDSLTFIPMMKRDIIVRGFNQSEFLCNELKDKLNLPVLSLKKIKRSNAQKKLSQTSRRENLKGCFKADKKLFKGKRVLIVDDVLTTGATGDSVAEALKKAGATKIYLITVAAVEYKFQN